MKRVIFVLLMMGGMALQAQSVDYELLGFLDGQDNLVEELLLGSGEDFTPSVRLKNNGTGVPATGDSVYFDIYYNGSYATYFFLRGSQLQNLTPGQEATVSLPQPLMTAEMMDESVITAFQLCIEVRIVGSATDPVADNNRACVQVNRPLPVSEYAEDDFRVWPNPANDVLQIHAPSGTKVEVFAMSGRKMMGNRMVEENFSADLSNWSAGMYFVKMTNGTSETVQKIIVTK